MVKMDQKIRLKQKDFFVELKSMFWIVPFLQRLGHGPFCVSRNNFEHEQGQRFQIYFPPLPSKAPTASL